MNLKQGLVAVLLIIVTVICVCCSRHQKREVVVYTSVDEEYSKVIFQDFEKATQIKVKPVYDVEATKSAGLANRIIAEQSNPQADVFWSGEPLRIIELKKKGILGKYVSPSAADIPDQFKDAQHYWTGFGGRLRVIIYNRDLISYENAPRSIYDCANPKYFGKCAIANPLFGTTTFHFVSLLLTLGEKEALDLFTRMKANKVRIVDGNSIVRKLVELGEIEMGLTDSDDAELSLLSGKNIGIVYPDADTFGTPLMPNMVGLIKDGSNTGNGKFFIDYLLDKVADEKLLSIHWTRISVRDSREAAAKGIKTYAPDYERVSSIIQDSLNKIRYVFEL